MCMPRPKTLVVLFTLASMAVFISDTSAASVDFAAGGTISLSHLEGWFDFKSEVLEEGLCRQTIQSPFEVVVLDERLPPDFETPIIRSDGGGVSGKVFIHVGPGFGSLSDGGVMASAAFQRFCVSSTEEIHLSCGRFSFEAVLDSIPAAGDLHFVALEGVAPEGDASAGDFEGDLPLALRFRFTHLDDGWQAEAHGDLLLHLAGPWSSKGLDDAPTAGSPIDIDGDCDGLIDDVSYVAPIYLGVLLEDGAARAEPVCADDIDGRAFFCALP